jgi:hypothetical protein
MKKILKIDCRKTSPVPQALQVLWDIRTRIRIFDGRLAWMVYGLLILSPILSGMESPAWADIFTRIVPEKQRVEIGRQNGTFMATGMVSLYEENHIRYFSAGVGLDERRAIYPSFSLKCVFASKPKPYLARVSVTIRDQKGKVVLTVPSERVTGPWLFVDLPKGTYSLTATRLDGTDIAKTVTLGEGKTTVAQFRWPHS